MVKTADQIYAEVDTSSHIYDGRPVPDTPGNRLRGWQRICLLVCFFGPSQLYSPEESFDNYAGRPIVFPVVCPVLQPPPPTSCLTFAAWHAIVRHVRPCHLPDVYSAEQVRFHAAMRLIMLFR